MKPKFFRDPIHLQIRFDPVDLNTDPTKLTFEPAVSWAVQKLIDTPSFQRLRQIRQNGLANLVFHGMEHSRFSHSMGVFYLAREMHDRIVRNMGFGSNSEVLVEIAIASLVHDVGHGPFSHTFEEVLRDVGVSFQHETMTKRIVLEDTSDINKVLVAMSPDLPGRVAGFFDKTMRGDDHWKYKVVSSQMDADRLDYANRDARFAGLNGHSFDLERLLDLISVHDGKCIAVERGALESVEAYLITLDHLYRAIYYHRAVRAANNMYSSALRRALFLEKNGDKSVFPSLGGEPHPILELLEKGDGIKLSSYVRLTDTTAWWLLDLWSQHSDAVLSMLSQGLLGRVLFKSVDIVEKGRAKESAAIEKAKELTRKLYPDVDEADEYFVMWDDPSRVSYKGYDWGNEGGDESIWLTGGQKDEVPLESFGESQIILALRRSMHFDRLVMPTDVREMFIKS